MINIYAFCDNNCKHLVYTREEVLSLLQQAINDGSLKNIDADYAAVKSVVDSNAGSDITFWTGTEAEFNALNPAPKVSHFIPRRGEDGKIYICIDDTSISNLPTTPLSSAEIKAICDGTYKAGDGDFVDAAGVGALWAQATDKFPVDRVGDIKVTRRTTLGEKWLLCNGEMINGAKYPALAAICDDMDIDDTGDKFNKGAIEFADGVFVAACVNSSNYLEIHAFEYHPDSGAVVYKDSSASVYSTMNVMVVHNDKDGMWYVFACSSSDKFRVYATDDPLSGNWTKTNPAYHDVEFGFAKACCYNGTFVILGEVGDLPTVLVSTNPAESWTANTVATFKVDDGGVCCHNGTWVLALSESKDYDSYIMVTDDPLGTWEAFNISGVSFGFNDICCHGGVFAVVDGYRGDVHYTTDPRGTWTKSEVAQELKEAKRIKWLNGYWVIAERVNFSPSDPAFVYTSDLNSAWTYKELTGVGSGHSLDMAYGNGVWVALGDMHSSSYTAPGFIYKGKKLPKITHDGAYTYIRAKE